MSEQFEMIAKTFQGLEEILAEELTALGANDIQIGPDCSIVIIVNQLIFTHGT